MKNPTLFLVFSMFISNFLVGQTNSINLGLEGGAGIRNLFGNEIVEDREWGFGYTGGLTFQYNVSSYISIRSGLSYERKGQKYEELEYDDIGDPIGNINFESNMDYILVPILGRVTIGENVQFFMNAGPYFGFLIKQEFVALAHHSALGFKSDNIDNYERIDIGLSLGLGGNFPLKERLFLNAEVRGNMGLKNLSKLPVKNDGTIQTASVNLLIGVAYRLGMSDK